MDIVVGDVVARCSYGCDVCFTVIAVTGDMAVLKGVYHRLEADVPIDDVIRVSDERLVRVLDAQLRKYRKPG